MAKYILTLLFLFTAHINAQLAIINDTDGYINVRYDKNANSKIVGRLFNDDAFLYYKDEENDEWIDVYYNVTLSQLEPEKRNYYIKECNVNGDSLYITGYIHKSRLMPIDQLKKIPDAKRSEGKRKITIKNDSISLYIETSVFNPKAHKMKFAKDGWLEKIDGSYPWGANDDKPKIQIDRVSLIINGQTIFIPRNQYKDLFEPNLSKINLFIDKRGIIYIYMPWNSDGGGGYDAVWIIKDKKFLKRYVDGMS